MVEGTCNKFLRDSVSGRIASCILRTTEKVGCYTHQVGERIGIFLEIMKVITIIALFTLITLTTGCHTVDVTPRLKKPTVEFSQSIRTERINVAVDKILEEY